MIENSFANDVAISLTFDVQAIRFVFFVNTSRRCNYTATYMNRDCFHVLVWVVRTGFSCVRAPGI